MTGLFPRNEPRLSLSVIWCRDDDAAVPSGHGDRTDYLGEPERFRACDPDLFDHLSQLVRGDSRSLAEIERSGVLGDDTSFHEQPVRVSANVVFFDPDIGLAFDRRQTSGKYLQFFDIDVDELQTLVIYQSFGRNKGDTHERQMARWSKLLEKWFPNHAAPRILRYRPFHPRSFLIVPLHAHLEMIDFRLEPLLRTRWATDFELLGDDPGREA